jgi:hypothetical protein
MEKPNKGARVYIAGPMNSVGGNFNFPLFDYVAERLRELNCVVFSPADHAREFIGPLEEIQKLDKKEMAAVRKVMLKDEICWIIDNADFVLMLPGWERSTGATAERAVALAIDIPVRNAPDMTQPVDSFRKTMEITTS